MNFENALVKGGKILSNNKIKSSLLESEILMSEAINKDRKFVINNLGREIKEDTLENFKKLIFQRASGKPIAYIMEKRFLEFPPQITRGVLIPDPILKL